MKQYEKCRKNELWTEKFEWIPWITSNLRECGVNFEENESF